MNAKKSDANQAEIVATLRACGAFVFDLHGVGRGCPDLLCCHHGQWMLIECKDKDGRLTPEQVIFVGEAGRCRGKVYVVRSTDDAVDALNEVVRRGPG